MSILIKPSGMLEQAFNLANGESAQSIAMCRMTQATQKYQDSIGAAADDAYKQGLQMVAVTKILTAIQPWMVVLSILTAGAGGAVGVAGSVASEGASAAVDAVMTAFKSVSSTLGSAIQGLTSLAQGVMGGVQGGLQSYKSSLEGGMEKDKTVTDGLGHAVDSNGTAMKALSQGAGKQGGAIVQMVTREGSVAKNRF